jgi:hypothetical protein
MKYIAHRALFNGPDIERENHPDQIVLALSQGFDVEIDVRFIDEKWLLGHDSGTYEVSDTFFRRFGLWIHCKNLEALYEISSIRHLALANYFWHDTDEFVLTSHNWIWTYPRRPLTLRSIWVQPEWDNDWQDKIVDANCYGICSKYVGQIQEIRKNVDTQ